MRDNMLVYLGGQSYCIFPWLGTRPFRTFRRFLQKYAHELGISDIRSESCHYIKFKAHEEAGKSLLFAIRNIIERDGIEPIKLVGDGECPIFDKYDEFIPPELLREAYARDRLSVDDVLIRFE